MEILEMIELIKEEEKKCCTETLQLIDAFRKKYNEVLPKMPYNINIIDELHINENGHSRILTKLLQFKNQDGKYEILESLLKYIVEEIHCENFRKIKIFNPEITQEKERIDLWIRDKGYALIFENKIYNASDQEAQIHRYIEKTIKVKQQYEKENIYVIYLPKYPKEPADQSWGIFKEDFKDRYANVSFRNGILPWLKNYVLPNVEPQDNLLLSAVTQYIDYLEGIFGLRTINNKINMALQEQISEKIFDGNETSEEKLKILESKKKDVNELMNQMNLMIDRFVPEWLKGISERTQAELLVKEIRIKKYIGNITIVLGITDHRPWWGVLGTDISEKQKDDVIKKIENNIYFGNLNYNNQGYYIWSYTSYENGESRFNELIKVLSEDNHQK